MDRRRFLRLVAGTIVPVAASGVGRAWAQSRPPAPAGVPARSVSDGPPGVTMNDLRIGMSAAFRGTAAGLGAEFYRGAQAKRTPGTGLGLSIVRGVMQGMGGQATAQPREDGKSGLVLSLILPVAPARGGREAGT